MLNNEFPPLGGGTGTVNKELLQRFTSNSDLKIDLITGSHDKKERITQLSDNIKIIYLPLKSKNIHHASNSELIKYTIYSFSKAIRLNKKEKYDFCFAWSTVPAGFVAFLLKIFYRLPYLVRVGGPDIPGFEERYKNIYKIISPIIRLIWRKSQLIITKCQLEKEMIHSINHKLKIDIIYNGVDSSKFSSKNKSAEKPVKIICSARLIKRKGQDLIIKSMAELKLRGINFHLILVGEGDEKENYIKLAKDLEVFEQIDFKGYIYRYEIVSLYQEADLFVLPSYNEGMSNSLLEAMACGLPVIVTNVGGTEELVKNGINGFIFQKGNFEELTNILEKISPEPGILSEMGKKSKEIAQKYDWQNIADQYYTIFQNLNTTN